ncbi:MAG: hypothetical protein NT027_03545 [Proteobacteria bacterium]|nr:hypothetical protein [Pseudomonadota bacterium]
MQIRNGILSSIFFIAVGAILAIVILERKFIFQSFFSEKQSTQAKEAVVAKLNHADRGPKKAVVIDYLLSNIQMEIEGCDTGPQNIHQFLSASLGHESALLKLDLDCQNENEIDTDLLSCGLSFMNDGENVEGIAGPNDSASYHRSLQLILNVRKVSENWNFESITCFEAG